MFPIRSGLRSAGSRFPDIVSGVGGGESEGQGEEWRGGACGFKLPSAIGTLGEMIEAPGPGERRSTPVQRIEIPEDYDDFPKQLRTGDILFMKNTEGEISHAILWVGDMGKSPDREPIILDSTGESGIDSEGNQIPDGIYLRAFRPTGFYFKQASHAIRVIPDEEGGSRTLMPSR